MRNVRRFGVFVLVVAMAFVGWTGGASAHCEEDCERLAREAGIAAEEYYYYRCLQNGGGMTQCESEAQAYGSQVYLDMYDTCITAWHEEEAEHAAEDQLRWFVGPQGPIEGTVRPLVGSPVGSFCINMPLYQTFCWY